MGELNIRSQSSREHRLTYINHLLDDIKSLEYMLKHNRIESGVIRLGAEQECCLVNNKWRPASNAKEIHEALDNHHFTTELAKYNIEINLDPFELVPSVFQKIKTQLDSLLKKAHKVSEEFGSKIVLAGILPSISMNELNLDYMTPEPRYFALNEMILKSRGADVRMQLNGVDELAISHSSMMFEACNTSFQMHLQINPNDFESAYNWAQAIAGPVLAAAVNAPLLLGKELWSETRIALFQQSIDTRKLSRAHLNQQARVSFGEDWVNGSIVDHYRNEVSRFAIMLTKEIEKNSFEEVLKGKTPKLEALNLHNGTVYRWNRPCYGASKGKAHIRIENRYIPAGPSVNDEIANMAFWVGLMHGRTKAHEQLWEKMDFKDVKSNFLKAATHGAEAVMVWMGKQLNAKDLIIEECIPIAQQGLEKLKIDSADISLFLGIIRDRLNTHTGAQWMVKNYRKLRKTQTLDQASLNLTKGIYDHQWSGKTVSEWPTLDKDLHSENHASRVGHIMTRTTITAHQADSARLTVEFMKWNNIHHLPVLNDTGNLVGLITWSLLDTYWDDVHDIENLLCVEDIMIKEVITVQPSTPIPEAFSMAKKLKIGCLPIIQNEQLVGIITNRDIARIENA